MATLAERIALAEGNLERAAEDTRTAYRTYCNFNAAQTLIADELKDLRRQQRNMNEQIEIARRELADAAEETRESLAAHQQAEANGRSDGTWEAHMEACRAQDRAQSRLDELEKS